MYTFLEITSDHSYEKRAYASDNKATYILTSAYAHDMYTDYLDKYYREPSSRWFNKHFQFERLKNKND